MSYLRYLDCLILEGGTDRLSRNVGNYRPTLRNIPEEQISHLRRGGRLKITHDRIIHQQLRPQSVGIFDGH